jgi:hypothetical protein
MCLACCLISGLAILFYFTESPRFLLSKGHHEKGLKSLYFISKKNFRSKNLFTFLVTSLTDYREESKNPIKTNPESQDIINSSKNDIQDQVAENVVTINPAIIQKIINEINQKHKFQNPNEINLSKSLLDSPQTEEPLPKHVTKEASFISLIKYKSLRTTFLCCCYLWFAMAFTYYGISMGLKKSEKDIFKDGYIVYTAEALAYLATGFIMSSKFFGRKRSISINMLLSALSTIGFYFFDKYKLEPYSLISLFLARFGITSIYSLMYTYSTEVYPTIIRAKGLGTNALFARFASVLVPVVLEFVNAFLIFPVLCIIGLIVSFYIPETFGKPLEDEIEEEKKIKSNQIDIHQD